MSNSTNTISAVPLSTCNFIVLGNRVIKVVLLLPLCSSVLYLGARRCRQQGSFRSHSDLFTFHLAAMELFWVFGFFCFICQCPVFTPLGNSASLVAFYGEIFFHVLTCMERYLAVVHPIIYHKLKNTRGLRIKVLTISGVWLLCFGLAFINVIIHSAYNSVPLLCILIISILSTSFCSFYALCALIRPKPGLEKRDQIDPVKSKAFHTIIYLWSIMCLWFVFLLLQVIKRQSLLFSPAAQCLVDVALNVFNLCSSLVLPLLFLHREGKISCSFNNGQ